MQAAPIPVSSRWGSPGRSSNYVGDERVLKLRLPVVIRSGGREGVLEATPTVLFNYHLVGEQYLPGKVDNCRERDYSTAVGQKAGAEAFEIAAAKRPFKVCGKLTVDDEWAVLPLNIYERASLG